MYKYNHISFDLDGTLIDSFAVMEKAWNHSMVTLGLRCEFSRYRKLVGYPFPVILEMLGLHDYENELTALYFAATKGFACEVETLAWAPSVLEWASNSGISTSIITSKPRVSAEQVCELKSLRVDTLICGDDYPVGKPNPLIAQVLFTDRTLAPNRCLYVGDMIVDYQFALNVGMDFALYTNNNPDPVPSNLVNNIDRFDSLERFIDLVTVQSR